MTDPYNAMTDAAEAERKAGDAMIEARQKYYSAHDDYASPIDKPWNPDDPSIAELNDAYEVAYTAWEQAHEAANRAVSEWLKTVT